MKILSLRHVGIIVDEFDKMLNFYIGLGLELRRRDYENVPFIEHLLNLKGIRLETAKLILQDKNCPVHMRFNLELMKIINNDIEKNNNLFNKKSNFLKKKMRGGVF
jgi:hypothetical protein